MKSSNALIGIPLMRSFWKMRPSMLRLRLLRSAIVLTVAFSALLQGCSSATLSALAQAPKVRLVDIEPLEIGLFEQFYALTLIIDNPNDAALPIQRLDYEIRLNNFDFAKGASEKSVVVPANSNRTVTVGLSSTTAALSRQLRALSDLNEPLISYEIDGEVEIGDAHIRFPFNYSGEVGIFFDKQQRDPLPPGMIRI